MNSDGQWINSHWLLSMQSELEFPLLSLEKTSQSLIHNKGHESESTSWTMGNGYYYYFFFLVKSKRAKNTPENGIKPHFKNAWFMVCGGGGRIPSRLPFTAPKWEGSMLAAVAIPTRLHKFQLDKMFTEHRSGHYLVKAHYVKGCWWHF